MDQEQILTEIKCVLLLFVCFVLYLLFVCCCFLFLCFVLIKSCILSHPNTMITFLKNYHYTIKVGITYKSSVFRVMQNDYLSDPFKLHRGRKEGNVLFNNALNTFYLRLYGVRHMVKDHSDSEKGNPLPPHRLLFPINSKGSFICTIPQTG